MKPKTFHLIVLALATAALALAVLSACAPSADSGGSILDQARSRLAQVEGAIVEPGLQATFPVAGHGQRRERDHRPHEDNLNRSPLERRVQKQHQPVAVGLEASFCLSLFPAVGANFKTY